MQSHSWRLENNGTTLRHSHAPCPYVLRLARLSCRVISACVSSVGIQNWIGQGTNQSHCDPSNIRWCERVTAKHIMAWYDNEQAPHSIASSICYLEVGNQKNWVCEISCMHSNWINWYHTNKSRIVLTGLTSLTNMNESVYSKWYAVSAIVASHAGGCLFSGFSSFDRCLLVNDLAPSLADTIATCKSESARPTLTITRWAIGPETSSDDITFLQLTLSKLWAVQEIMAAANPTASKVGWSQDAAPIPTAIGINVSKVV